ncbi:hypothetical protein M758_6G092700 [Ceratodon purpureus]|nr:hypothetical protein M758_6G092700 [Ceratodon purpureus]
MCQMSAGLQLESRGRGRGRQARDGLKKSHCIQSGRQRLFPPTSLPPNPGLTNPLQTSSRRLPHWIASATSLSLVLFLQLTSKAALVLQIAVFQGLVSGAIWSFLCSFFLHSGAVSRSDSLAIESFGC